MGSDEGHAATRTTAAGHTAGTSPKSDAVTRGTAGHTAGHKADASSRSNAETRDTRGVPAK